MPYVGQIDLKDILEKAEAEKRRLLEQKGAFLEKAKEEARKVGAAAVTPGVTRAGGMGIVIGMVVAGILGYAYYRSKQ